MRIVLAASIAVLLGGFACFGQVEGRLTGSVVDPSGAAIPGATVNLLLAGGKRPVLTAKTTSLGLFTLIGVRPEYYDVTIEARGFVTQTLRRVKVDPSKETSLPPIRLELATVAQSVEVAADFGSVETSNAEITQTVTNQQVRELPIIDRYVLGIIGTQAGVTSNGLTNTVINGQRTSYSNVTLDGINIQDNFIRENALDYTPNLLQIDQVSEFSVTTSNANATAGGGSAQVSFSTPSGTNEFHGALYWYNRNNVFSANDWFNNKAGVKRPFLNQNQLGGKIGGPILKDKLLFYTNYEATRQRTQTGVNRTILTDGARRGIFTYRDTQGNIQKVNILQRAGVGIDPTIQQILGKVPTADKINNFDVGDSSPALLRNRAGYRFNQRSNRTRDNLTSRLDFIPSTKHSFSGSYLWNRDLLDRPDVDNSYAPVPFVTNDNHSHLLSAGWRWNPGATFTNELRGGFNLAPGVFNTSEQFGKFLLTGFVFDNPTNLFRMQGRNTNTYNLFDNASYIRGRHNLQFGFRMQQIRVEPFDEAGITPIYSVGIGTGNNGLTQSDLPGIGQADLDAANALLASLGGFLQSYAQTFNITSRTSGFVDGARYVRHYNFGDYAWFVQDTWKLLRRFTVNLGLRYELYSVVDERDALALYPRLINNGPLATLRSNGTLDFAGKAVGRPWYNRDKNNFAPNVSAAWDPFGTGRTAIRAGYSIHYVNDEAILASVVNTEWNEGLQTTVTPPQDLSGRISQGLPAIPKPAFNVPRTLQDNHDDNPSTNFGLTNPNFRTPYVQEWNFGIQHDFKGNVLEIRYVGNHATKIARQFDYNQVIIRQNGFLDDFKRAQRNGFLARAASGRFDPRFNPNIPGSERLTVFPRLVGGGLLTNSTVTGLIARGEAGQLAAVYQINELNGDVDFFPNPLALNTDLLTNVSNSTYNALQASLRRRLRMGLQLDANYTYSKVMGDSAGVAQDLLEHFLDLNNRKIERSRAAFDQTHAIKLNYIYELPLGEGHRLDVRPLRQLLSGWTTSGILTWISGAPFSILSGRGTLNRTGGGRAALNTATTTLNKDQLDNLLQFRMTGDGPFFVSAAAKGPDGRAVAADGDPPFQGQVFFNPGPGTIGALQRRMFSGPWGFNLDIGILKKFRITERQAAEFRMEAVNIFNHPTFLATDQSINSVNFGRITNTLFDSRIIQFGLYYSF